MFLLGKNMEELREVARETGLPPYAAKQMAHWIDERGVADIAEMTTNTTAIATTKRFIIKMPP